jgi:hypothetical protein
MLHPRHTGRLRPHEHTSYVSLASFVAATGLVLTLFSIASFAAASPGPAAGSVSLSGTLPANPPTTAAVIGSPANGQHFTTSPVTVSGSCPVETLVALYKNDIFAGSAPCSTSGAFSLKVDLLIGKNVLIARVYDALNQAGPDSSPVTAFYDILPAQAGPLAVLNLPEKQLLLVTQPFYRGTFPGQLLNVPITILGGVQPYAINVEWGDSTNKIISRGDNSTFNAGHTYQKPGTYTITLQASDSQQRLAFLQITAIVNGRPDTIAASNTAERTTTNQLLVLWPLYAIAAAVVVSFWLGEQREKRILSARLAAQPTFTPVS